VTGAPPVLRLVSAVPLAKPEAGCTDLLPDPIEFLDGSDPIETTQRLGAHLAAFGPRPIGIGSQDLIGVIDAVGLTGRGGGHFPTARKWRAIRDGAARTGLTPIVVANAAEGEPASAKDAVLLAHRPHLVLDGLVCAAEAVGATELVVWTHGESHNITRVLVHALHERRAAGFQEPPIRVVSGPGRYLSGESSAVVRALSGGPALPQFQLEPSASRGVRGRPTLVQNIETLARAALVARTGDGGYRGTSLLTVVVRGRRTVVEVEPTSTVRDAVLRGGWTPGAEPQAVLFGGYGGSWLRWDEAADLAVHEPTVRATGASLGAGVLAVLPAGACGLAEASRIAGYLARSSARQCGPCLFGLPAVAGVLDDLVRGRARRSDLRRLQRWAAEIRGRGACNHPDGAVRMTLSALRVFAEDVEVHRRGRQCAGATGPAQFPVPSGT
jgi:NADH:ubiquinone oxidoreductase subunit F (NADH-binding)